MTKLGVDRAILWIFILLTFAVVMWIFTGIYWLFVDLPAQFLAFILGIPLSDGTLLMGIFYCLGLIFLIISYIKYYEEPQE